MKPKILIVADNGYFKNIPHFMINTSYGKAISEAGGFPLVALDERLVMEYAEAYEVCDYGKPLTEEMKKEFFPF